ncbi:D-arabinono-1,4-lactone oxidase [Izhakiella australiensis]|uniref:D-arabinono-1,4-lactone oxidase n=1 Tax=Izhakiella australiensis TaxID=1926881 RepID=A0A1S8YE15_9GAMM|nr:D-arabinono-1,4-lactone oxidase [Izhakiella australiensis]OON37026.1 D-arabinono-1,4-lactone oxidase [Izhakiella australiensis]
MTRHAWQNWGGNQRFTSAGIARPLNEQQAITTIRQAVSQRQPLRVAGSGHSFTPVVETPGMLLDLSALSGVINVDKSSGCAEVWGGTRIADLGEPLWQAGLSIANQGDIDVQTIAGAIATGTKGSGTQFGSLSSRVTSLRIVNGLGEVVDIDRSQPEWLYAGQVAVGMLGPVLRVGLQLVERYKLREENIILPLSEVLRQWDYLLAEYRHFSFWWMPAARSAQLYKLGEVPADHCFVKLLRELPDDGRDEPTGQMNNRTDRAYRIYPDGTTVAEFHELEYMVSAADARAAMAAICTLMKQRFPDQISPLQVRWQQADRGFLSAQNGRDSVSLSVSGEIGRDYQHFLRAVDAELRPFNARPHWGKLHFLDRQRVEALYPDYHRFQRIRRENDPDNLFLNPHLAALFRE